MRNKVIAENDMLLVCNMFCMSCQNQVHGMIMLDYYSVNPFALSTVNYCTILMFGLALI